MIVTDEMPTIKVTKVVTSAAVLDEPGGNFDYLIEVENTCLEPVTLTTLSDLLPTVGSSTRRSRLGGVRLMPGGVFSWRPTHLYTEAGIYANTASAIAYDDQNNAASGSAGAQVEVVDVLPTVSIVKSATPTSLDEPGGSFHYTIVVTNTSPEAITFTLTDTQAGPWTGSLGVGASTSFEYDVSHTEAGSYPNTATVKAYDNEGHEATATDDETVVVNNTPPVVDLDKSVDQEWLDEPGGVFNFTLKVTNTGVEPFTITSLTDTNLSAEDIAAVGLIGQTLQPGESASASYPITHTDAGAPDFGFWENFAEVTVQDNEGSTASDSDSQFVTVQDVLPTVELIKEVTTCVAA